MNLSPSAWIEAIEKYLGQTKGWLQMHKRVSEIEQRLQALEAGRQADVTVCAHCGSADLTRSGTRDSAGPFGALGLKEAAYRCNACQQESLFEIPLRR